jgi:hypothetical protein
LSGKVKLARTPVNIHKGLVSSKQKTTKETEEMRKENALRANLLRRKQQERARGTKESTPHSLNHPDSLPAKR